MNSKKKLTNDVFIKRAKVKHGDKYDYSKVEYTGTHNNLRIICPEHGEFEQIAKTHIHRGSGCPMCSKIKLNQVRYSTPEFIEKAKEIHGNTYDYSKTEYKTNKGFVTITCLEHGDFKQRPSNHLSKRGCKKCAGFGVTKDEYIEACIKVHGNTYDYSNVIWDTKLRKIELICKKHGLFKVGKANHRLLKQGCGLCSEPKGERIIRLILEGRGIKFNRQQTFNGCVDKKKLQFDFYISDMNLCIEYDGIQHFKVVDFFGGRSEFMRIKHRDKIKTQFCNKQGINLFRINYKENIEEKLLKYLDGK